ncbi:MAG: STAS-like domain-containing protein [Aeromonas sp.]
MGIIIDVATDFSPLPIGRYPSCGASNGSRFRDEILKKALSSSAENILVDFSNVKIGVGSPFLEESFGGLVRAGFDAEKLKERIQVTGGLAAYPSQVIRFIDRAASQSKG